MIVVALIPAYNSADRIEATVAAASQIAGVTRTLVVDDGSTDDTALLARSAGAEVLRLPANRGKGGAVAAGVDASPDADVFLLLDADLQDTASEAASLLPPVLDDEADLTIAVLPPAAGRGGFGIVRDTARWGIRRAGGFDTTAPLSGQRAVKAELLRGLHSAERFGLEVAMTTEAARAGARIIEVEAAIEHRHTGRSLSGFRHRARQGSDVIAALWPRLTTSRQRKAAIAVAAMAVIVLMVWSGTRWEPSTEPLAESPDRVVVFGLTPFDFDDVDQEITPTLARIQREGAMGAMTVRTIARRPSTAEGYLSLGAGARLRVASGASLAMPLDAEIDGVPVATLIQRVTGSDPTGAVGVVGAAASIRANQGVEVASEPGALADALTEASIDTAVVGVADHPAALGSAALIERPVALAAMSSDLTVASGEIEPEVLLTQDPSAPYGVRSDTDAVLDAVDSALDEAGLVVVDPGDLQRAARFRPSAFGDAADEAHDHALAHTDSLLGALLERVGPDTTVYVVSVAPRGGFRLTPFYAIGEGIPAGSWITSPSTKRTGLSTLTDIAPTVVHALTGSVPEDFPGNPVRYEDGPVDLDLLQRYDRETIVRERTYFAQAQLFILFQAFVYAAAGVFVLRRRTTSAGAAVVRWCVLAAASYPAATFVVKAVPWATAGPVAVPAILAILTASALATLAVRRRSHSLAGFELVAAVTVALLIVDAATGTWLHVSSWLGYSLHSAGRFYGMPNTSFAVLGAATILLGASWVHHSVRRSEAVVAAGALFVVVIIANGAPFLGGDVGGIITFVPVFGLTLVALAAHRIRIRTLVLFAIITVAILLLAAGVDLTRPASERTHLGRFASEMLDEGFGPLIETFLRKQAANLRIFRVSIWTWMIPVVAGFILSLLAWGRGGDRMLPRGSASRVGAISVVSAALLGFAANDSGPIVIALFFVYLLAYLALLALDRRPDHPPMLLAPTARTEGR